MKLSSLGKNLFFNLFASISIFEFLLFLGIIVYDFFYYKVHYISLYSILRLIFKLHFIVLPINALLVIAEQVIKTKYISNIEPNKINKWLKVFYIFAMLSFILMTLVCLFVGYPPAENELRYD